MRICVLNSLYESASSKFQDHDPPGDPSRYLPEHEVELHFIHKATAAQEVEALARRGFDVFINLCDGLIDEERAGIGVVHALERCGVAFTGAGAGFYEPTRDDMKEACQRAGIDTPRGMSVVDREGAERAARELRFPLIVKHPNSYGSIGLTRSSRVETPQALLERVDEAVRSFGGALVEEFIEGREFTVLVAEPPEGSSVPNAYPPIELRFPPGETFKHFDIKWVDYGQLVSVAVEDAALAERLKDITRRMFTAMEGTGYGRCDIRMDAAGRLFILEINPNCGIFYAPETYGSADLILSLDPAGHRGFLDHLIRCAQRRRQAALGVN
jgi:D-alanine-D-alanine ligase